MRIEALKRRLAKFKANPLWVDDDCDGFLSACGALPGETSQDALRRQAKEDWAGYL